MDTATDVIALLGITAEEWSGIAKPGIWYRVQPVECDLSHNSTTSNDCTDCGVHVVQTLEQAVLLEGAYLYRSTPHEVVVIAGPLDLRDTGDVEGWVLPEGSGRIIGRYSYSDLEAEYRD